MKPVRKKGRREAAIGPWTAQMIGVIAGLLSMVTLAFVGSLLVEKAVIPEGGIDGWVLAACFAGTFTGSVAALRGQKKKKGIHSLGTGAFIVLVLMATGVVLFGELDLMWGVAVSAACLAGGTLSWVITKRKN